MAACGQPAVPATAVVTRGDIVQTVHAAATAADASEAKIGFKVGGRISKIDVAAGDQVKQGQILAELDTSELQVALEQAQAARDVASAGLTAAQAKVDQLLASAKPENISQAQASADIARQKLADMLAGGRPEQIAQAQAGLDAAQQKLDAATKSGPEQVAQAQAAVQAAQARLDALQRGPRPEQVAVLQSQVDAAKNALFAAQTTRDADCNPRNPDYMCSAGNAQAAAAQGSLTAAQRQLALATAPPTDTDVQAAQAAVDQATAQLAVLQDGSVGQDQQAAQDAVTQAQQALALTKKPFTDAQIQQARDAVSQADAAVSLAQHPFSDADVALAQAGVQQAQAALTQAQAAVDAAQMSLGSAQLTAPADGRVLQINNVVGELVTADSTVMGLGSGDLMLNANLPETAAPRVATGQPADVRFDSLPGQVFAGTVAAINPGPSTAQNLTTYLAKINLDKPLDALHVGMTADVTIYVARKRGVLTIPNQAVQSYQGRPIVLALGSGGQTQTVNVQLGLTDGDNSEVLSGLTEGQHVEVGSAITGPPPARS